MANNKAGKQKKTLPEEELVVLLGEVAVVVVGVGVSGMLVVGMMGGDGVIGARTGDDKSNHTAGPGWSTNLKQNSELWAHSNLLSGQKILIIGSTDISHNPHERTRADFHKTSGTFISCYKLL